MVDATDQHHIEQPLHFGNIQPPTVSAENFAHGFALFVRIDMCLGKGERRKRVVEKFRIGIAVADGREVPQFIIPRFELVQHNVDTSHVLPRLTLEIMPRSQP